MPAWHDPVILQGLAIVGGIFVGVGGLLTAIMTICRKPAEERQQAARSYFAWLVLGPALIGPLLLGAQAWIGLVLVLALLGFREFGCATGLWRDRRFLLMGLACVAAIFYPISTRWYGLFLVMPVYVTLALLCVPLVADTYEHMIQRTCLSVLGVLYLGWCLSHLAYLIHLDGGMRVALFVLVLTEGNDIASYLVGKAIGRRPLSPRISPRKTIEGAIGGVVATVALGWLFRAAVPMFDTRQLVVASVLIAVAGTLGDLTISFIKRDLGIKDMGRLIPGHGGILDRIDSLVFVAPVFFHFTVYSYPRLLGGG